MHRARRQPGRRGSVVGAFGNPGRVLEHATETGNEGITVGHQSAPSGLWCWYQWLAMSMRRGTQTLSCDMT
ncbi:hypothetical protein D3C85_1852470 [compost metagenome]